MVTPPPVVNGTFTYNLFTHADFFPVGFVPANLIPASTSELGGIDFLLTSVDETLVKNPV